MPRSRQLSLVVAVALLSTACTKKEDQLTDDLEVFAREMCRCDTTECVGGLDSKRDTVRAKMKDLFDDKDDVPEKLAARIDGIDSRFDKCRADALAGVAIRDLAGLRTKMCRCKDKPCADRVNADLEVLAAKHQGVAEHPEYERRAKITIGAYKKCMMDAIRGAQ